jgi:hypothetical protein
MLSILGRRRKRLHGVPHRPMLTRLKSCAGDVAITLLPTWVIEPLSHGSIPQPHSANGLSVPRYQRFESRSLQNESTAHLVICRRAAWPKTSSYISRKPPFEIVSGYTFFLRLGFVSSPFA